MVARKRGPSSTTLISSPGRWQWRSTLTDCDGWAWDDGLEALALSEVFVCDEDTGATCSVEAVESPDCGWSDLEEIERCGIGWSKAVGDRSDGS